MQSQWRFPLFLCHFTLWWLPFHQWSWWHTAAADICYKELTAKKQLGGYDIYWELWSLLESWWIQEQLYLLGLEGPVLLSFLIPLTFGPSQGIIEFRYLINENIIYFFKLATQEFPLSQTLGMLLDLVLGDTVGLFVPFWKPSFIVNVHYLLLVYCFFTTIYFARWSSLLSPVRRGLPEKARIDWITFIHASFEICKQWLGEEGRK